MNAHASDRPTMTATAPAYKAAPSPAAGDLFRPERLLVVEDHADTLDLLRRLFEMEGYLVLAADSAARAAALAASDSCDLLISDVALPDGSGLDLMRDLRRAYGLKGIAVSGFTSPADVARAREAGFQRFLHKPVQFEKLIDAVRELMS